MSSGYGFWSDMSIGEFLNGKVNSVNNYIIYGTNVWFLMSLIVKKKYAL